MVHVPPRLLRWMLVCSLVIWVAGLTYAIGWSVWRTYDGKNLKGFAQRNIAVHEKNRALERELQSAKGEAQKARRLAESKDRIIGSKQRIIEMLQEWE